MDIWICITESLYCTVETNTTLQNNYTPIKKKKKKMKIHSSLCIVLKLKANQEKRNVLLKHFKMDSNAIFIHNLLKLTKN